MSTEDEILSCIAKLRTEAASGGYNLNPNEDDLKLVVDGYLENEKKFGYPGCPC